MNIFDEKYQNHVKTKEREGIGKKMSEIILGGQDGLVNTLGVILGIAAATTEIRIILAGGLAAAIAESISMASVAYTSKLADYEYYMSQLHKEKKEINEIPEIEREEVKRILISWNIDEKDTEKMLEIITKNDNAWLKIMMSHELGLNEIESNKPAKFAIIVGISAIIGSLIPIIPFIFIQPNYAWIISIIASGLVLLSVGYYKTKITIGNPIKGGLKLMIIGIVSALAGFIIGTLFRSK